MIIGSTINYIFYVKNLGSVLSADSLPVCVLIRNGIDTVVPVTVSQLTDNSYSASFTIPDNWIAGETIQLRISAVYQGFSIPPKTINLGILEDSVTPIDSLQIANTILNASNGVEPGLTLQQALQGIVAVLYGKDQITPGAGNTATVVFRNPADNTNRLTIEMDHSERITVTPNYTPSTPTEP